MSRSELRQAVYDCTERCLIYASKWAAQLMIAASGETTHLVQSIPNDKVLLAQSYFRNQEYDRAAFCLRNNLLEPLSCYLHFYASFLAAKSQLDYLALRDKMIALEDRSDPWILYIFALILTKVNEKETAIALLCQSINAYPFNWSSWELMGKCMTNDLVDQTIDSLDDSPVKNIFIVHLALDFPVQNFNASFQKVLLNYGESCIYQSLDALTCYNNRQFQQAETMFQKIYANEPDCLDYMDIYSNTLYCLEKPNELGLLAQACHEKDKYRLETCIVAANYASICFDHNQSIIHLQRALKLDDEYYHAWTLIGHEYVEMRDTNSAVEAYRRAVDLKPTDYRAWFGLGQAYHILGLNYFSLNYYQKAAFLRGEDSRMWTALAEIYVNLDRVEEGLKAYKRALVAMENEPESNAIPPLYAIGTLLLGSGLKKDAAFYFKLCVADRVKAFREKQIDACKQLADYYEGVGDSREAAYYLHEADFF